MTDDTVCWLQRTIQHHARYSLGKDWTDLTPPDRLNAVALAVRDRLLDGMIETEKRVRDGGAKRLCYLSIEFLLGPSLRSNLLNLGLHAACETAVANLGAHLPVLEALEPDAALGNGGLGRLAACFLDSLASLGMPGYGYGINYEYGLFKQAIDNGYQREQPDNWLKNGSPWQIARTDEACVVPIYGCIEHGVDRRGGYNPMWMDWKVLLGVPYDMPVPGWGGRTVNFLRLFSARSSHDFDMGIFNDGDYLHAVQQKISSETISKVLYPSDAAVGGQELRLLQEYFLVACTLRDLMRRFQYSRRALLSLPQHVAIQLNDTHPALAVAELMRLLVDEKSLEWEEAWGLTQATLSYTNHTLAAEALERWPLSLLENVLPRHLQIILEINRRFLQRVEAAWPGDANRRRRMSMVDESDPRQVRMAHLAMVGSHAINGVSALHSELVKAALAPDFFQLWPERFTNKTNGITPRRWLLSANPELSRLITSALGEAWVVDLERLRELEARASDAGFLEALRQSRRANKTRLAGIIRETIHLTVSPESIFDVHVKRIHAYKRQLLQIMHVVHQYLRLVEDGRTPAAPRAFIFAGKAAPGYWYAKQIIKLIHAVARVINDDPRAREWIRVAFIPDYRVSLAESIIPAADVSEQISTAGTEASGTGCMKLALNGAVTVGTLDGANIEMLQQVGTDNMFTFGLTAAEVRSFREQGNYRPWESYTGHSQLKRVVDSLAGGRFCPEEPELFRWIADRLLDGHDEHFHVADFMSFLDVQERVSYAFLDEARWTRMALLNTARMGWFSSDRTVAEYARDIWRLAPT